MITSRKVLSLLAILVLSLVPTLLGCGQAEPRPPRITPTTTTTESMRPATPSATPSGTPAERRARFLDSLREAGVPVSQSGDSEVLIAEGICKGLAAGTAESELVKDMQSLGAVWTSENALAVVRSAGANYCTG